DALERPAGDVDLGADGEGLERDGGEALGGGLERLHLGDLVVGHDGEPAAEAEAADDGVVLEHGQPGALVDVGEEVAREERLLDALLAVGPLAEGGAQREEHLVAGLGEALGRALLGAGLGVEHAPDGPGRGAPPARLVALVSLVVSWHRGGRSGRGVRRALRTRGGLSEQARDPLDGEGDGGDAGDDGEGVAPREPPDLLDGRLDLDDVVVAEVGVPPRLADDLVEDGLVGEDARVALGAEDADGRGDDLVLGLGPRLGPARQREELAEGGAGADLVEARGADGAGGWARRGGGGGGGGGGAPGRPRGRGGGAGRRPRGGGGGGGGGGGAWGGAGGWAGGGAGGSEGGGVTGGGGYLTGGCLT